MEKYGLLENAWAHEKTRMIKNQLEIQYYTWDSLFSGAIMNHPYIPLLSGCGNAITQSLKCLTHHC